MNNKLMPIVLIIAVGLVGLILVFKSMKTVPPTTTTQEQKIQSVTDLDIATTELDAQDIDGLGNEFNQTDADASTF